LSRKKLQKFKEIKIDPLVIEAIDPDSKKVKGCWNKDIFKNQKPIVLELACGYGEYTINLASLFSQKNFIGVDIKGDRIYTGLKQGRDLNLNNFAFLRTRIENLLDFFEKDEVEEIWITFPDPRPKQRESRKRLTSHRFLSIYKEILMPAGILNLKTDNSDFFEFSLQSMTSFGLEILNQTKDLYNSDLLKYTFDIKTRYEKQFWNSCGGIKYLRARF
jgi:tRNA (guanine-N7-)-methyltransferase